MDSDPIKIAKGLSNFLVGSLVYIASFLGGFTWFFFGDLYRKTVARRRG